MPSSQSSSLPSIEAIRQAMQQWKEQQSPEAKQRILEGIIHLTRLAYRFEPEAYSLPLYRVTKASVLESEADRHQINPFSYPPPQKCEQARANVAGCPVFYVADNPITALKEASSRAGDCIYLSKWQLTRPQHTLFYLFLTDEQNQDEFWTPILQERERLSRETSELKAEEEAQLEQLHALYCEVFSQKDYVISSLIGHYLLYDYPGEPVDVLLYPSQADACHSCNFAIATRYADQHLQLSKVCALKIGKQPDFSDAHLLEVGIVREKEIIWHPVVNGEKKIESVLKSHSYPRE